MSSDIRQGEVKEKEKFKETMTTATPIQKLGQRVRRNGTLQKTSNGSVFKQSLLLEVKTDCYSGASIVDS